VVARLLVNLAKFYMANDCTLAEINPLVVTKQGEIVAIDAKVQFDDNALFRHPEIVALKMIRKTDPLEVRATKANLNYIKLDGSIACLVNGAGLAMATMDVIKLFGGSRPNFLDVGGADGGWSQGSLPHQSSPTKSQRHSEHLRRHRQV